MMSRNSCSKRFVRNGMKRNLWAVVLSTVGFFMAQLMPVLMTAQQGLAMHRKDLISMNAAEAASNWEGYVENVGQMLGGTNPFAKLAIIVLAVTCGISMFAYLHNRQKVDFYHSLPVSRSRLFAVNYATGALCSLVPYFVMHLLSIACAYAMGFGEAVSASLVGVMAANVIFFFLLYALAALTTIFCGNTIITLLLGLWVYFGPMLANVLRTGLMSMFFQTYSSEVSMTQLVMGNNLSPLIKYFGVDGTKYATNYFSAYAYAGVSYGGTMPSTVGLLIGYAAAAVVITAVALVLFRHRRSERAGTALAFKPAKLPVKVIICAVMGVAFAELFYMIVDYSKLWFWVGLVLGTVIFHCVVEIIYAFDFRAIFRKPVQLVIILAVLAAGVLTMQLDVFGYDKWLPDEGSIKAAALDVYSSSRSDSSMLTEPENIAAVRQLAALGVENLNHDGDEDVYEYITAAFELQNGKIKVRSYHIPSTEETRALEKQVYQSAEYKQKNWSLFSLGEVKKGYHRSVDIYTNGDGYAVVSALTDDRANEVLDTLKAECLTHTGDAMPVMRLEISQQNNDDYISEGAVCVTDKDVKTLALIKQYANTVPKPMSSKNVTMATIGIYMADDGYWQGVNVTDKADLDALLKNAVNISAMNMYDSNSIAYGIVQCSDTATISVEYKDEDSNTWTATVGYTEENFPNDIVEKYRPEAERAANGVARVPGNLTATEGALG